LLNTHSLSRVLTSLNAAAPTAAAAAPSTVAQLKAQLRLLGLPVSGSKQQLLMRLAAASSGGVGGAAASEAPHKVETKAGRAAAPKPKRAVKPGTKGLGHVATAAEAAKEKLLAGENRAVEHVALADEEADELTLGGANAAADARKGNSHGPAAAESAPQPAKRRRRGGG
jgi:hypothetical protein